MTGSGATGLASRHRPRLAPAGQTVTAFVLSTQHVFLPTLFDWRFIAWRGLMILPFALWFGFALDRRPRPCPSSSSPTGCSARRSRSSSWLAST